MTGEARPGAGAAGEIPPPGEPAPEKPPQPDKPPKKRRANPLLKRLTPDAVVKRMRFGKRAVTCVIDHFGPAGPEVFSEENAIYLNADHPLFVREADAPRAFVMYVARLFAQEIALMQDPRNPRKAFDLQSRILREAFREEPGGRKPGCLFACRLMNCAALVPPACSGHEQGRPGNICRVFLRGPANPQKDAAG